MDKKKHSMFCIQTSMPEKLRDYLIDLGIGLNKQDTRVEGRLLIINPVVDAGILAAGLRADSAMGRQMNRFYVFDSHSDSLSGALAGLAGMLGKRTARLQANGKQLEELTLDTLEGRGVKLNPTKFKFVASLVAVGGTYYYGVAGRKLYATQAQDGAAHTSRAYYKIEEAVRRFRVPIKKGWRALDIGAAPGGWSELLSDLGCTVVAVDPARMEIQRNTVLHVKKRIEDAAQELSGSGKFDMIVCDMNCDPRDAARILVNSAVLTKPDSYLIMTVKYPHKGDAHRRRLLDATITILEQKYDRISVKELISNTNMEATLSARRMAQAHAGSNREIRLFG